MPKIHSLFASPVISNIVDDLDTEQIQKDKIKFKETKHLGYNPNIAEISRDIRILENYPTLEMGILKWWEDAAYNVFNYRNDFKITTSWVTRTKKGCQSTLHLHKNSFYSGIFYYGKYSDKSGGIEFMSPLHEYSDFSLESHPPGIHSADNHQFCPKHNLLLFFPSYLKHRIMYHADNTTRYSLAFNIVPTGLYGVSDAQYNTEWFI